MRFLHQTLAWLVASVGLTTGSYTIAASEESPANSASLEIIDPYAEVHSGPGRGYPIFYVIEQGETIEVLTRRPDWYEVRARGGRIGWVEAAQIARTLQPTGEPVDLPSVSYGDYLKNSWRVGFSVGPFTSGELKSSDAFHANFGYRPLSWLAFDVEYGSLYGSEVRGDLYNLNAVLEPFSSWRVSPVLLLGAGEITIDTQPKLTPLAIDEASFQLYGLGVHYYIGRSFVVRAEFRQYTVSTDNDDERLGSWKLGFNTFF